MARILVAGASGHLGRQVVRQLNASGFGIKTLSRGAFPFAGEIGAEHVAADLTRPETLAGVCDGVDAVISCAGAPLHLKGEDRRSYLAVDFEGNRNLLDQALLSGVEKFVYVSLYGADRLMDRAYARGHEYFVFALENAAIDYAVVRPTGFFYTFLELLEMARRGLGVVVGAGTARTNPIHEADVARLCVEALGGSARQIEAGGPETLTRRAIVELAFDVLEQPPRILRVPPFVFQGAALLARPFHRRVSDLLDFVGAVSVHDAVAPPRGQHTLRAYFEETVRAST